MRVPAPRQGAAPRGCGAQGVRRQGVRRPGGAAPRGPLDEHGAYRSPMGSVLRAGRRLWRPPGRVTNVTLLLVLLCAFGTGVGAVATGSDRGRWVVAAHGIAGL